MHPVVYCCMNVDWQLAYGFWSWSRNPVPSYGRKKPAGWHTHSLCRITRVSILAGGSAKTAPQDRQMSVKCVRQESYVF